MKEPMSEEALREAHSQHCRAFYRNMKATNPMLYWAYYQRRRLFKQGLTANAMPEAASMARWAEMTEACEKCGAAFDPHMRGHEGNVSRHARHIMVVEKNKLVMVCSQCAGIRIGRAKKQG